MLMGSSLDHQFPQPTRPANASSPIINPQQPSFLSEERLPHKLNHPEVNLELPKTSKPEHRTQAAAPRDHGQYSYDYDLEQPLEFYGRVGTLPSTTSSSSSSSVTEDIPQMAANPNYSWPYNLELAPEFYPKAGPSPSVSSSSSSSARDRVHLSPATGKTPKGEKEAVDELLLILVDCLDELGTKSRESLLRKFFAEVEKEERLERFIVERLNQSKVKAISELCDKIPAAMVGPEVAALATGGEETSMRSVVESAEELSEKLERFKVKTLDFGEEVVTDEEGKKESK